MTWLKLVPVWCWWLIALVLVAGGQQYRILVAQGETDAARLDLAEQARLHQSDLAVISAAAAAQSRRALEKQQQIAQMLQDLDTKLTKEKTDALNENDRLRRAVADGDRRLRIAGTCPSAAGGGGMPGTAGTASLGDAGTVELAPVAGRNILDIRAGIIADQAALRAAQTYIRDVCLRP